MTSNAILIGAEIDKVLTILLVTAILAVALLWAGAAAAQGVSSPGSKVASLEERETDVILGVPRRSVLEVSYVLPDGMRARSLRLASSTSSMFARVLSASA